MKFTLMALPIFAALVIIGSAMGDGEGGEPLNTSPTHCPLSETPEGKAIIDKVLDKARECIWIDRLKTRVKDANSTQSYLTIMKDYCDEMPISRQCLAEAKSLSALCLDEDKQAFVNINVKQMLQVAETCCADEGVRLATILEDTRPLVNASENVYDTCYIEESRKLDKAGNEDDRRLSVYNMDMYKLFKNIKGCLVDSGSGTTWKVDIAVSLIEDYLKELVCFQEDGPEVLCATIYTA